MVTSRCYRGYRLWGRPGGDRDVGRQRPELDAVRARDSACCGGCLHQDTCRLRLLNTLEPTPALVHIGYGPCPGTHRLWYTLWYTLTIHDWLTCRPSLTWVYVGFLNFFNRFFFNLEKRDYALIRRQLIVYDIWIWSRF